MSSRGGLPAHAPSLSTFLTIVSPHMIILPPGRHLSPFQHTEAPFSLHQNLLPPCLRHSFRTCLIPCTLSFLLPKYLLTMQAAAYEPPFYATTSPGASPFCCTLSPCCKSQVLSSTPPTPPLLPASSQCTFPVSEFPLPRVPLPLPCFSRSCPSAAQPSDPSTV